tara:strand:+ start:61441 stop:62385 length:945 start_codon:yes stop_codon:yes gene_type:complete
MKVSTTTKSKQLKLFRTHLSPYQKDNFSRRERECLESRGFVYCDSIEQANVLITNTHTNLKEFDSKALESIELIIHPNSGYDNFDPNQVQQLKSPIILGNKIRAKSVSNYVLSCIHHALTPPPFSKQWQAGRKWPRKAMQDLEVQLIGFGHIGSHLNDVLSLLVKSVHLYDPYLDQHDLKHQSDIIILCCSLNQENLNLIDEAFLKQCKEDLIFINPARGKLVQTNELIQWFKASPRAKAYLDVFESEPFDLALMPDNCFCTSHIAGVDSSLDQRIIDFVEEVSLDYSSLSEHDFTAKWSNATLGNKIYSKRFV